MKRPLSERWFLRRLVITCEEYTELASKRLEDDPTPFERRAFFIHHIICFVCRRFLRQLRAIHEGCERLADSAYGGADSPEMSPEARVRLQSVVEAHLNRE